MTEEWKDVAGYEGLYMVSNIGRVKSLCFRNNKITIRRDRLLAQHLSWNGRIQIDLSKDGVHKRVTLHRLVAQAFIPNPDGLPQINHKDGNPRNCHIDNLEWCTASHNMAHAYRNGLNEKTRRMNEEKKKPVMRSDGKYYDCAYAAAEDNGVSVFSIRDALKGRTHTSAGYSWRYV